MYYFLRSRGQSQGTTLPLAQGKAPRSYHRKLQENRRRGKGSNKTTHGTIQDRLQECTSRDAPDESASMLEEWFTGQKMICCGYLGEDKVYTMTRTREVCLFRDDVLYVVSPRYSLFRKSRKLEQLKNCDFYDYYGIHEACPGNGKRRHLPNGPAKLEYTDEDQTPPSSSCDSDVDSTQRPSIDIEEFIRLINPVDEETDAKA